MRSRDASNFFIREFTFGVRLSKRALLGSLHPTGETGDNCLAVAYVSSKPGAKMEGVDIAMICQMKIDEKLLSPLE